MRSPLSIGNFDDCQVTGEISRRVFEAAKTVDQSRFWFPEHSSESVVNIGLQVDSVTYVPPRNRWAARWYQSANVITVDAISPLLS